MFLLFALISMRVKSEKIERLFLWVLWVLALVVWSGLGLGLGLGGGWQVPFLQHERSARRQAFGALYLESC
jgi:hypothetical protein